MFSEYIDSALETARYRLIDDTEPYYGEIPVCRGVWATGRTLEECRRNLKDTLEGWIIVSLKKGLTLPVVKGRTIKPAKKIAVNA